MSAAERASAWLWAAYAPFLLSYGESPARAVLVGEVLDALVVLLRRKVRGEHHLDFALPPLAEDPKDALDAVLPLVESFNGALETRVLWADLPTAAWACARTGWDIRPYEREYLYRRQAVLEMKGAEFRPLRKRLSRCEREAMPEVRPYCAEDHPACVRLLKDWQDEREDALKPVFDFGYTRAALDLAAHISEPFLTGLVVEVEGRIRAFAFGGLIRPGLGQFFLLKSDPHVLGLAETARVALMERLEGCDLINDAGDLDRPGLAQHKRMFRPVAFVPTFKLVRSRATSPASPRCSQSRS